MCLVENCVWVRKAASGILLPNGDTINDLEESGYKYLGVLQEADVKCSEMKDIVRSEYLRRVKAVVRSNLYAKNLITAINVWAVSVVRYFAGVIDWNEKEMKDLDVKTRKILTMYGVFHKKSSVDRLYMKRNEGGRGLISVEDCVKREICSLKDYFDFNPEFFTIAANEILFCDKVQVIESESSFSKGETSASESSTSDSENYVKNEDESRPVAERKRPESGYDYKERILRERDDRVWNKPMHGKFFREIAKDATADMYEWVTRGRVNKTTEAFIFAAQEHALPTNWLKARISGEGGNPMCRKCGLKVETVTHLVSSCSSLSQYHYRKRHDKMGLRVYWELCKMYGIKASEKWYLESPEKVRKSECGKYEIWWDRLVETPGRSNTANQM